MSFRETQFSSLDAMVLESFWPALAVASIVFIPGSVRTSQHDPCLSYIWIGLSQYILLWATVEKCFEATGSV